MTEVERNLYFRILNIINNTGVNSFKRIAKSLDISEELLKLAIQSLLERGYLTFHDDKKFHEEAAMSCKICPFSNECSERVPTTYYELSQKGKSKIKNIRKN